MSFLFDAFKFLKGDSIGKVSQEKKEERINICKSCKNLSTYFVKEEACNICGCIISEKTKYKDEKCPINKW